jgi:hypothetical protein
MRCLVGRLVVALAIAGTLTAPLAGQTEEWHTYTNEQGNFSVLLPIEPKDTTNGDPSSVVSHTILALSGSNAYMVVFVFTKPEQSVTEAEFKVYRDSVMKTLPQCAQETESPASPTVIGYIGHWYRMNCSMRDQNMTLIGNLYWGRHYAYAVFTLFPPAPTDPPTAKKFSDSFSVFDAKSSYRNVAF